MRQIVFAIILALASTGVGRSVFADCQTIDQLDKLYVLQSRLARDPNTPFFTSDIRRLRIISSELSNRSALESVNGNALFGKGVTFVQFLENTQALLNGVSVDDPQSAGPHFSARVRQNLQSVGGYLIELRCSAAQIAFENAEASQTPFNVGSDAEDLEQVRQTLSKLADKVFRLRTIGVLLVATIIAMIFVPKIRQRLIVRLRRASSGSTRP